MEIRGSGPYRLRKAAGSLAAVSVQLSDSAAQPTNPTVPIGHTERKLRKIRPESIEVSSVYERARYARCIGLAAFTPSGAIAASKHATIGIGDAAA